MKNKILLALLGIIAGSGVQFVYSQTKQKELEETIEFVNSYKRNEKKIKEQHLLIKAILQDSVEDANKAIENGAKVDYQQDNKRPLFSIYPSYKEAIAKEHKNIQAKNLLWYLYEQVTPLGLAIRYNRPVMVKLLLEHGANPNLTFNYQKTPLMSAAESEIDDASITTMLLKYGADPHKIDKSSYTALYYAFISKNKKIMEALVKNDANINERFGGETLLFKEVNTHNADRSVVKKLLELGADPNITDNGRRTPLIIETSVRNSNIDIVDLLLKFGANPNLIDNFGESALMNAIDGNSLTIIETLLINGANKNLLPTNYVQKLNQLIQTPETKNEKD